MLRPAPLESSLGSHQIHDLRQACLFESGVANMTDSGRLGITPKGYQRLKELQAAHWKRLPPKRESGVSKTISWTGQEIFDLASVVAGAVSDGRFSTGFSDRQNMRRQFLALGHRVTIGQFDGALGIFRGAKTTSEVFEMMGSHRSYGDWWKALSAEARTRVVFERRNAHREFVASLTPSERLDRRRQVNSRLGEVATEMSTPDINLGEKMSRALSDSLQIKYLEKGLAPGNLFNYAGVPERMRSSWEALFDRAVMRQPNRFYVYEPMGFPLMDKDGRISAYHPDFFAYKSSITGELRCNIVEIKGELTTIGQRKIGLFRKLYIEGDFSDLSDAQRAIIEPLVKETKHQAWLQFRVRVGAASRFAVYGYLPWDKSDNCFADGANSGGIKHVGLVKRLELRYPELVSGPPGGGLSNSRRREILNNITKGEEEWKLVPPGGAKIARSTELIIESKSLTRLYFVASTMRQALLNLESRGEVAIDGQGGIEGFYENAILPYFDLLVGWHAGSASVRKELLAKLERSAMENGCYTAVFLGAVYLRLVRDVINSQVAFDFDQRPDTYLAARAQFQQNAIDLIRATAPLESSAETAVGAKGHTMEWRVFVSNLAAEMSRLLDTFPDNPSVIEIDVPYVCSQYAYWSKQGLFQMPLIRRTGDTMHGRWQVAWQADGLSDSSFT